MTGERTTDTDDGAGSLPVRSTVWLWLAPLAVVFVAVPVIPIVLFPLRGILQAWIPESIPDHMNSLAILMVPVYAGLLTAWGVLCWAVGRYLPTNRRVLRAPAVAGVLLVALLTSAALVWWIWGPDWSGFTVLELPALFLLYLAPLVTTASYAAFAKNPTLTRILSVATFSLAAGVVVFLCASILVGAPTD